MAKCKVKSVQIWDVELTDAELDVILASLRFVESNLSLSAKLYGWGRAEFSELSSSLARQRKV